MGVRPAAVVDAGTKFAVGSVCVIALAAFAQVAAAELLAGGEKKRQYLAMSNYVWALGILSAKVESANTAHGPHNRAIFFTL